MRAVIPCLVMSEVYRLKGADLQLARRLAEATFEQWRRFQGHYNNTVDSHLRGKVGEIAVASLLEAHGCGCERVFEDLSREDECDIVVGGSRWPRVDVKTWNARYWAEMGRCVSVSQLPFLRRKADAVVWCISPRSLTEGAEVEVRGWSTIEDIEHAPRRVTGPAGRRQVDNHQVEEGTLRPFSSLTG
jgi:hypothetical protein